MDKLNEKNRKQLPTLEDLKTGKVEVDPLRNLLEQEPPTEWLRKHPTAKNKTTGEAVLFLPIERVDYLLRSIFVSHWWEVLSVGIFQNSVQVTGRLFFVNPVTGRVEHSDGVGGAVSGQGMETAVPIAESNAKKSAAKKLGKIFGRDLSRDYGEAEEQKEEAKKEEPVVETKNPVALRIIKQIKATRTKAGLMKINANIQNYIKEGELSDSDIELITAEAENKLKTIKK